ncbi:MAG: UDP-glucose--hexose-1-phosphate uridylyltransferase [Candidatus Xenobia bacterium]
MAKFKLREHPHRRYNPLSREWVLVSPHRTQRPWQGQVEKTPVASQPTYDPACYLCPGNARAGGHRNPDYDGVFGFDNDYPALTPDTPDGGVDAYGLIVARAETGICRVVCFSPRHDLTLATMEREGIREVVDVWTDQYLELGNMPGIRYVQIFENRGAMMGCSNPHPHCQIWASSSHPNEPAREQASQADYRSLRNGCLLCGYLTLEMDSGQRLVYDNEHFVVLVPFWAVWPFETMVLPRRHITGMDEMTVEERDALAEALRQITLRYDNIFEISFPYSMGFHQRPTDGLPHLEWHMHAHFYPPLLRSATVRKFMVGYEMLGSPQRDITAESAARRLREVPSEHYLG